MPGRSGINGGVDPRYQFTGKERDAAETGYDYFGARYYDSWRGQFSSTDPHASLYPGVSPYAYAADNPIIFVDPTGKDSVYFQDQSSRPKDNGTPGTSYTATVYVWQNGHLVAMYPKGGSTYPNSASPTDNSPAGKTVSPGMHHFTNKYGHTPHNKSTEKGLNLDDQVDPTKWHGTVRGVTPEGDQATVVNANVHQGTSDLGRFQSRGSTACLTINPAVSESFFSNFDWSGANGVTGNSNGEVIITRGGSAPIPIDYVEPILPEMPALPGGDNQ